MGKQDSNKVFPFMVWGLAAGFFMFHYVLRVAPAEMIPIFKTEFLMNMSKITYMQSAFFLSYILMQIPAGILIDRFPPHRVLWGAVLCVCLSSLVFYYATSYMMLLFSRVLLGVGSAFAFSGSVKMATLWFSRNYLGIFTSLTQVAGMIGAASQSLIDDAILHFSWRNAIGYYTVFLFVIWFLMLIIWRDHPNAHQVSHTRARSLKVVMRDFVEAMKNKQTWLVAIYTGLIYAPTLVFGEALGAAYVDSVKSGLSAHDGTVAIGWLFAGFSVGGIVQGFVSDWMRARRPNLFVSSFGSLIMFVLILYLDMTSFMFNAVAFVYGFLNSGLVIGYALAGEINIRRISGSGIAFANMMSVLIGTVILDVIGEVVEYFESSQYHVGTAYEMSFLALPVCLLLSLLLIFKIQESNCRSVDEAKE